MAWRETTRVCGALLAVMSVSALARPASAQEIERVLAGIRLGSKSSTVLARFGNPNEVVIGDVGIRPAGFAGQQGQGGQPGMGGAPMDGGDGSGLPGMQGAPGYPGTGGVGAFGMPRNVPGQGGGAAMGGLKSLGDGPPPSGGFPGAPGGFSGAPGAPGGFPGAPPYGSGGGFSGNPDDPAMGGGGGAGIGPFGATMSTLARQQEVTWIYNRKVNNNLISYEFLIGPNGDVSQIRVTGYSGGGVKTRRGIGLGATYKDVVKIYGYPEEHAQIGRILIASYRKGAHVQFQLMTPPGQLVNPLAGGNKVIGITIATVE